MKFLIRLLMLAILFVTQTNVSFSQSAKRDTGILNGAAYEITIPANWNKKLVMYAHGYEQPAQPKNLLGPNKALDVFLQRGFAVARSSYIRTGWALPACRRERHDFSVRADLGRRVCCSTNSRPD